MAFSFSSKSLTERLPETVRVSPVSSVTVPLKTPVIISGSSTPVIVTVTTCSVPSAEIAVKLSSIEELLPKFWTALFVLSAEYAQEPSVSKLNKPIPAVPKVFDCSTKTAWFASESEMFNIPLAVKKSSESSVKLAANEPVITPTSLVPVIVTVTIWVTPSVDSTVKLSEIVSPSAKL